MTEDVAEKVVEGPENELDFSSLEVIHFPVRYGKTSHYVLVEPSGDAAVQYRNACLAATQLVDGQISGVRGMGDVEPLLVSFCLHERRDDGDLGPLVKEKIIRSWPARVQKALFNKCIEIGDLKEGMETIEDLEERLAKLRKEEKKKQEQSGNFSGSTEDGSD